jgi:hypothetical protein
MQYLFCEDIANQQIFNLSACNVVMQYLFCGTEYCKVALIARKRTSGLTLRLSRMAQSCHYIKLATCPV